MNLSRMAEAKNKSIAQEHAAEVLTGTENASIILVSVKRSASNVARYSQSIKPSFAQGDVSSSMMERFKTMES